MKNYRTLTRFWPPPMPLLPHCIKGGSLCLAEIGSTIVCLAIFSANCHSQGMPKARHCTGLEAPWPLFSITTSKDWIVVIYQSPGRCKPNRIIISLKCPPQKMQYLAYYEKCTCKIDLEEIATSWNKPLSIEFMANFYWLQISMKILFSNKKASK